MLALKIQIDFKKWEDLPSVMPMIVTRKYIGAFQVKESSQHIKAEN